MKVLFIHTFYAPHVVGGAELTLQALVEGIAARGTECVVFTTSDQPGLHKDEVNGIPVWRAGLRNIYWHFRNSRAAFFKRRIWHSVDIYNPFMAGYVRQVVELEKPDVASCHNLPGWSVSAWSALTAKAVPIIQVLHDHYLLCPVSTMFKNGRNCGRRCVSCRLMRMPHPKLSRRLSGVVGVSRYILDRHRSAGYFRSVPIQRVIHNARLQKALGLVTSDFIRRDTQRAFRFGFIGSLMPGKGIELLLKVFAKYSSTNAELWVAGRGYTEYETALKRQYAGDTIRFLGRVKPNEFFLNVDVVIVPSLWQEPLGMVVAEALAFGLPVIGSHRGGISEMIEDGINGFLFEPNRPQELVQIMQSFAMDPELRARMSIAARTSAAPFMDMERFLSGYEAVYQAAIEQPITQWNHSRRYEGADE